MKHRLGRAVSGLTDLARHNRGFTVLLAAAALLRLAVWIAYRPILFFDDSVDYVSMAADGSPVAFAPTSHPSGYPVLVEVLSGGFRSLAALSAFQHLMGLVAGALVYALLVRLGTPRKWAVAAAAVVLLDLWLIALEQYVATETTFLLMTTASAFLVVMKRSPWAVVAGGRAARPGGDRPALGPVRRSRLARVPAVGAPGAPRLPRRPGGGDRAGARLLGDPPLLQRLVRPVGGRRLAAVRADGGVRGLPRGPAAGGHPATVPGSAGDSAAHAGRLRVHAAVARLVGVRADHPGEPRAAPPDQLPVARLRAHGDTQPPAGLRPDGRRRDVRPVRVRGRQHASGRAARRRLEAHRGRPAGGEVLPRLQGAGAERGAARPAARAPHAELADGAAGAGCPRRPGGLVRAEGDGPKTAREPPRDLPAVRDGDRRAGGQRGHLELRQPIPADGRAAAGRRRSPRGPGPRAPPARAGSRAPGGAVAGRVRGGRRAARARPDHGGDSPTWARPPPRRSPPSAPTPIPRRRSGRCCRCSCSARRAWPCSSACRAT